MFSLNIALKYVNVFSFRCTFSTRSKIASYLQFDHYTLALCFIFVEEANNFGLSSAFLVENVFSLTYKFTALVFMD